MSAVSATSVTSTTDSHTAARLAWHEALTGGSAYSPKVEPYLSGIGRIDTAARTAWESSTRGAEPWADLQTSDAIDLLEAFRRVKAMSLAWSTVGGSYEGAEALLAQTESILDWLTANRYNASTAKIASTWWIWEIGIPLELNDITVLLFDERTSIEVRASMDAVERFSPSVTRSGANRVWAAMVVGLRGVIVADSAKIAAARDGLTPVFRNVTSGNGFYADGSFVDHNFYAYTGGYGVSLLANLARVMTLLDNTPWEVTVASVANVYEWIPRSFDPFMKAGAMMDTVRGREISREWSSDHDAGAAVIRAVLALAETAPAGIRSTLLSIAKRWLTSDGLDDYWDGGSLTELRRGHQVETDSGIVAARSRRGTVAFNSMDRAVHHAASFAFSVGMSSARIANYESINSENNRGWFTGDGMTALYGTDHAQYSGNYWGTVNPYRLPGTTVDTNKRLSGAGANTRPGNTFAGSVASSSGLYGASGMQLDAADSTLTAQKAWFYFDDEVVAVGSGVTATGQTGTGWDSRPRHVETVIDNRTVDFAAQSLTVDGVVASRSPGVIQQFTDPAWAYLSGAKGSIGYVMPGTAPLSVLSDRRTGAWRAINAEGATNTRSGDYISLFVDHGTNPTAARYSYIQLPGASLARTRAYASAPDVQIHANSTAVAAVGDRTKKALGAVFWQKSPATVSVDGSPFLTASTQAVIFTEVSGGRTEVTVTDPTHVNGGVVEVEIKQAAASVAHLSPGVTVTQLSPSIRFTVDVADARGASFAASFVNK